jgi:MFS family permease
VQPAEVAADHDDARAGRRERLAMMIGFGLGSLAWNVCWPFLPLRVQAVGIADLGEVARTSGLLAGMANTIQATLGPAWSQLGERFGYRLQLLRSHAGTAFAMSAIGLARTPTEIAAAAASLGMLGGNYPHYMALAASRTPANEVGRVVGDLQAAGQIGGTIGPLIGGLLASQLGLTATFVVSGLISFGGVFLILAFVRHRVPHEVEAARPRGSLRQAFARPEQRWLMLFFLVGEAGVQGLRPLIPIVITARADDPSIVTTTTGLAATLVAGGTVASALVVGRLSRQLSPRAVLLVALPVAAVLAAALPILPGIPLLIVGWTLMGFAGGATAPAVFAWLGRLGPAGGGGYALLASTSMLGYAIGPVIAGQASVYSLDLPFRVAAALATVTALMIALRGPRPVSTVAPAV